MNLIRITRADDPRLELLWPLYQEAFPPSERREKEQLEKMIETKTQMYFNAVECDGQLCGLFVYWDLREFYYLEHLAVFASMRNKKVGQQVLDYIAEHLKGTRLLEVEPPADEITTRRVKYYQRNGYEILEKQYRQPSYRAGGGDYPLWIMGNREPEHLSACIERIQQEVYRGNYDL